MKPRARAGLIEPITNPLGNFWYQPDPKDILIDEDYAYMSKNSFGLLADYSRSLPYEVYPGKMWRNTNEAGIHRLCWFSTDPVKPKEFCRNNYRIIVIMENLLAN